MSDSNGVNAYNVNYHPRLCHLTKWDDFNGYGFNLHAEKGKAGQYIGKVDEGSPAQAAKLRQGDRIVEVNGVNIGNENHQQVVQRIKAGGDETKLLVVDAETDLYFKEHKIIVRGEMEEVIYCKTPPTSDTISSEGPVHVNSNHVVDADTLNHNEETGEMTQEIKEVTDGGNEAAVVMNGTKEEAAPEEPAEVKENGISESVEVESVIKVEEEVAAKPEITASEPEIAASEPEIAASEIVVEHEAPEPAIPEPEPEPELEPEPIASAPEPESVASAPEPEPIASAPEPVVVTPEPQAEATKPPVSEAPVKTQTGADLLDFGNVTVEEMKKRIQSKKKIDTRFSQMGLREKYDLLQRL